MPGFELPSELAGKTQFSQVPFESHALNFKITGMSDIMPYPSRRFSSLSEKELAAYRTTFTWSIQKTIDTFKPDLIHSHHLWILSSLAAELSGKVPVVTTCHGTCLRQHELCPDISRTIIKSLQKIDAVIALSRDQKEIITRMLKVDPGKIAVISGGYNQACFFYEPKTFDGRVHLLYAGKLSKAKGLPWLLNSLKHLENLPYTLHIAGSGPEKDLCLSTGKMLGKERVVFHGALSHEDLGDLMRKAHLFVLPSFYEGLPLVLMEAAACGCRIVATDLPGVKEIFGEHTSAMVDLIQQPELETIDQPFERDLPKLEIGLSERLRHQIQSVIQKPCLDESIVRAASSPYTWEQIFARIQDVYQKCVIKNR